MFPCGLLVNTKEVWIVQNQACFIRNEISLFLLILLSFAKFLLFFSHSVVFNGVIIRSILSKCLGLFLSERLTGSQSPLKFNEYQAT